VETNDYPVRVTSSAAPLLSAEFFRDPHPTYRHFQARGPVVWVEELTGWLVTSFDGCRQALGDHERFSSARASQMIEAMVPGFRFGELLPRIVCDAIEQDFLFLDPPQHSVVRRELGLALRKATAEVEPALAGVAEELAEGLERASRCDIAADFAAKIPAIAMGMMLGLRPDESTQWQRWTFEAGPLFGASPALADDERRACMLASVRQLNESIAELLFLTEIETPLVTHVRGLVKTLVWGPEEALGAVVQLYAAGVLTTGDALALGVLALLENPTQLAHVESGAAPLDQVIDEILRFTSPTQVMHRLVRDDTELEGVRLRRGDLIYAVLATANRDPRVFVRPDRFDVMRPDAAKHIGFGVGVHRCIGAALSRLELRAGLAALVPRLRRWVVGEPPSYRDYSMCFRGIDTLTLAATPTQSASTAA
jgi:cytochrome P450